MEKEKKKLFDSFLKMKRNNKFLLTFEKIEESGKKEDKLFGNFEKMKKQIQKIFRTF